MVAPLCVWIQLYVVYKALQGGPSRGTENCDSGKLNNVPGITLLPCSSCGLDSAVRRSGRGHPPVPGKPLPALWQQLLP